VLCGVPLILALGISDAYGQIGGMPGGYGPAGGMPGAYGPADNHTSWWFGGGVDYTDNATLTSIPTADTMGTLMGGIDLYERSRLFNARLLGAGQFIHYFRHTFDNDWLGSAIGHASYGPETVMWVLDATFGQLNIDPTRAIIPTNRQNMALYTTGPDFRVPLASDTNFVASLRYGQAHFGSTSYLDDERATAMVGFEHHVSATTMWGMNADATRIVYHETGTETSNPSYEQYDVYARIRESASKKQTLSLDLGVNSVHGLGQNETAPLVRLDYLRHVTPRLSVTVNGGLQYQNVANQVSGGVANAPSSLNPQNVILTTAPFEEASAGAAIHYVHTRTQFDLGGGYGVDRYVGPVPNRHTTEFDGRALRRMTPLLTGVIHANYTRHADELPAFANTWKTADARLSYEVGRDIFVDGGYRYTNQVFGLGGNYHVNEVFLLVLYRSPGSMGGLPGIMAAPGMQPPMQ
jgi:hypothetical protein